MKATIEVSDELYRRVKAKAALNGRSVRDVTAELYERWLEEEAESRPAMTAQEWLDEWMRFGAEALRNAPPGPSAREILEEDRSRPERNRG